MSPATLWSVVTLAAGPKQRPRRSRAARWALLRAASLVPLGLVLSLLVAQLARTRGQDTDLFPRWYGLRQLLLEGRNPYGEAVSREIAAQTRFLARGVSAGGIDQSAPPAPLEMVFGFLYPLPGALLLAPLAAVPYEIALPAWLLATLLMLPATAWLIVDVSAPVAPLFAPTAASPATAAMVNTPGTTGITGAAGTPADHAARLSRLLAIPLGLLFLPTLANLLLAQPAPAVALLVALAAWLSLRGAPEVRGTSTDRANATASSAWSILGYAAGAALAGAVALKPHLLAVLGPLWLGYHCRRWRRSRSDARSRRFVLGAVATGGLLALTAFTLVPSWAGDFAHAAAAYAQVTAMATASPTLFLAARAILPESGARIVAAVCSAVLLGWAFAGWRTDLRASFQRVELRGISRAVVTTALVVPPAWETNAVMLVLPLAVTLGRLSPRPAAASGFTLASIAVSVLDFPLYLALPWRNGAVLTMAYAALLALTSSLYVRAFTADQTSGPDHLPRLRRNAAL